MIKLIVKDWNWNIHNIEWSFDWSISDQLEEKWIQVLTSCKAWACSVCSCKVVKWMKYLEQNKLWEKIIETDDDEFLSCIWWIKRDYIDDDNINEIEIELFN